MLQNIYQKYGIMQQGQLKYIIPNFKGNPSEGDFPPTESYAQLVLTKHLPWHGKFDLLQKFQASSFLELSEKIILSSSCPIEILLCYILAQEHHNNRFHKLTSQNEIIDYNSFSSEASEETRALVTLCNIVTSKTK